MKELIHIRNAKGAAVSAEEKERLLLARLAEIPSLIVALSGGADSAYLSWTAHKALGARALSVTALSPSYSAHDRAIVEEFVGKLGVRHEFIETHEMDNPAYLANAANRWYFCKDELFSSLDELAQECGFAAVAYGVNADDTLDFRPGHRAATEHRVLAPLLGAGLLAATVDTLAGGHVIEVAQDQSAATDAPRLTKHEGLIDWGQAAERVHNLIRGLHPWPHAYSFRNGRRLILRRSAV